MLLGVIVKLGRESAVPPLECCRQVLIALSGPHFGVVKRGEVAQKRPEALRARFPSVIVSQSRTPACCNLHFLQPKKHRIFHAIEGLDESE